MKISFTKHASQKMKERKIGTELIKKVLNKPAYLFYDLKEKTFVAIDQITIDDVRTNLVVVFTKEKEKTRIVTTYPCKNIEREINRKENIRWVKI